LENKKCLVDIPLDTLIKLALEHWRHNKKNKDVDNLRTRKLKNEIEKLFEIINIKLYDLEGDKYDPGLAIEIIYYKDDKNKDETVIEEMVSPIIIYNDEVVKYGQAVLSGPKKEE